MANAKDFGVRGLLDQRSYPIQPGAVFYTGDFLALTTTGLVPASAPGANATLVNRVVGRALNNSADPYNNGASLTHVDVQLAQPGTQFAVSLYHTTPASAVPTLAQIGADFELRNSSTNFPQVDLTATTNKVVRIVEPCNEDCKSWPDSVLAGVQYALVWVEFIASQEATTGAR